MGQQEAVLLAVAGEVLGGGDDPDRVRAGAGHPGVAGGADPGREAEVLGGLGQVLRQLGGDLLRMHHRNPPRGVAAGGVGDGAGVHLGTPSQLVDPAVVQGCGVDPNPGGRGPNSVLEIRGGQRQGRCNA